MTTLIEAAKAVVARWDSPNWKDQTHTGEFIDALRKAIQEAEQQEPVARPCHVFNVRKNGALTEWEPTAMAFAMADGTHALYTQPPAAKEWQGLTDDEVVGVMNKIYEATWTEQDRDFSRAIEAKLKEKNT